MWNLMFYIYGASVYNPTKRKTYKYDMTFVYKRIFRFGRRVIRIFHTYYLRIFLTISLV